MTIGRQRDPGAMSRLAMAAVTMGCIPNALTPLVSALGARNAERYKPAPKCLLPACNNEAPHRGGYCSPEHCREHKQMDKARRMVR